MRTAIALLTFTMLNLFSTPVFAYETTQPVNVDFSPTNFRTVETNYKEPMKRNDYNEVMFYIPVYTMTVKQNNEPAVAPAGGAFRAPSVIMPVYNSVDKSKQVIYPSNPGSSTGNNPSIPDNPNISDGDHNSGGSGNGGGVVKPPTITQNTPPSVSTDRDKKIFAAAPIPIPIIAGLGTATFKRGTKVKVQLCDDLSSKDRLYKKLTFVTTEPMVTTYSTIPIGTEIKGEIIKNKEPKNWGDGAVISVCARKIVFEDKVSDVSGIVTKAEAKKIFFNNIKGKNSYLSGITKSNEKGKDYYNRMSDKSVKLSKNPKTVLFSPFPLIAGATGMTFRALASPFTAIKSKGEPITIASGSEFELKLTSDCDLPIHKN